MSRRNTNFQIEDDVEEILEVDPYTAMCNYCTAKGLRCEIFLNRKGNSVFYYPKKHCNANEIKFSDDYTLFMNAWMQGEEYFDSVLKDMNHKLNFRIINKIF